MVCTLQMPYFARFHVHGVIGAGASGVAFEAHDPEGHQVVLKISRHAKGGSTGRQTELKRFQQEMDVLRSIRCRRFPRVYQCGWYRGHGFIAMERVEGIRLHEYIQAYRSLSEPIACTVAHRVCGAMIFAHQMGYVHRDLKPGNLIVCQDGEIMVLDFGLAKSRRNHLTRDFDVFGSRGFIAPEQQRDAKYVDGRADVYSVGKILLAAFTGLPVHDRINLRADSKLARVNGRTVGLRSAPTPGLLTILHRMLETDPERRWDMRQAERGIRAFMHRRGYRLDLPPVPWRLKQFASRALDPGWLTGTDQFLQRLAIM